MVINGGLGPQNLCFQVDNVNYICQQFSPSDQSNNMSADLLHRLKQNGVSLYKPMGKKHTKYWFLKNSFAAANINSWMLTDLQHCLNPFVCVWCSSETQNALLFWGKLNVFRMDLQAVFTSMLTVNRSVKSHSLLVASECCYVSKANAALTECVTSFSGVDWQLRWFLLPLPPSPTRCCFSVCNVAFFAWNLFSFEERVWWICVFLFIVPSFCLQILTSC